MAVGDAHGAERRQEAAVLGAHGAHLARLAPEDRLLLELVAAVAQLAAAVYGCADFDLHLLELLVDVLDHERGLDDVLQHVRRVVALHGVCADVVLLVFRAHAVKLHLEVRRPHSHARHDGPVLALLLLPVLLAWRRGHADLHVRQQQERGLGLPDASLLAALGHVHPDGPSAARDVPVLEPPRLELVIVLPDTLDVPERNPPLLLRESTEVTITTTGVTILLLLLLLSLLLLLLSLLSISLSSLLSLVLLLIPPILAALPIGELDVEVDVLRRDELPRDDVI